MNLKTLANELKKKATNTLNYSLPQKVAQVASSPKINQFAQRINDFVEFAKSGAERVAQTPAKEYFLPTSQGFKANLAETGRLLQRVPSTRVELNQPKPSPLGIGNFSPVNATGFLTELPGQMIKGYGETMEKAGTGQKLGFWDYMNLGDFVPGLGFIGGGVKAMGREGGEKLLKEGGEAILEKSTLKNLSTIKNMADNTNTLTAFKRRITPEAIDAIKKAGFEGVDDFWKANKEGFIKLGKLLNESLAQTKVRKQTAKTSILAQEARKYKGKELFYARNLEKVGKPSIGFGQEIEPKGKYINLASTPETAPRGWETGKIKFRNPLVIEWEGWKQKLSERYEGLTGSNLSKAIAKDGYDGIITLEKGKPFEAVSLTDFYTQATKGVEPKQISKTSIQKSYEFVQDMKREFKEADGAFRRLTPKEKVNIWDYVRTPDRILKKIGMADEAKALRGSWENYLDQLPQEIDKITAWSKRVTRPEGNQLIFKYLDGQITSKVLTPEELKVATEVKSYLKTWANKLNLPEDKRLTNYITHIWERDVKGVEFPEEIATLIRDKVAGSVYDPFVTKRLGQKGYVEDTWQALDAYVKRATRKVNLDDVLSTIKGKAEGLEDSQFQYIKSYIDRVNLRPTNTDTLIDNWIKSIAGYKFGERPVTNLTRKSRRMVYRGLLGLNPATALKNLSQGSNTYAELGEKYTILGYAKVVRDLPKYLTGKATELEKVGVLRNMFIEDRTLNATRKFWENTDKFLFYMFNMAEKINRGAAYYGGKARALNEGKTYAEAVEAGKDLVRKTQFTFGAIDTPVGLQSDLVKTFTQFMSYSIKQVEFLGEKVSKREFAGLIRYIGATSLFVYTIGKSFGMELKDIIPTFRVGVPPTMQLPKGLYDVTRGTPDKWGNQPDPNMIKRLIENKDVQKGVTAYIPAGGQMVKTFSGLRDVSQGESKTKSGAMRYPVEQSTSNLIRGGLFGQYNLPEAQKYYDTKAKPLSEKQSALVRSGQSSTYQDILSAREKNAQETKVREAVRDSGQPNLVNDKYIYLDKDSGEVKSINTNFDIPEPEYTDLEELDKELLKGYKSEISKAKTSAKELYKLGILSKDAAEKILKLLTAQYKSTLKGSSKKVTIRKVSAVKIPKMKELTKMKSAVKITKGPMSKSISKPNIKLNQPSPIYDIYKGAIKP